jgi:hypothetical protein
VEGRSVKKNMSSILKVSRQAALMLLVGAMNMIGINFNLIFMAYSEIESDIGWAACEAGRAQQPGILVPTQHLLWG